MLDATTRLERGIFAKAPGIEEIYRAKKEARLPCEIAMTPEESAIAQAQVVGFAKDYAKLADLLDRMDQRHLARAVRAMAKGLGANTVHQFTAGEIDMKDIQTVGDAIEYSERTIEALRLKAEELDGEARASFEVKAAPIIRDLSQMVPDPDLRARFGRDLAEPYPPGAGDERLIEALQSGQDEALEVSYRMRRKPGSTVTISQPGSFRAAPRTMGWRRIGSSGTWGRSWRRTTSRWRPPMMTNSMRRSNRLMA